MLRMAPVLLLHLRHVFLTQSCHLTLLRPQLDLELQRQRVAAHRQVEAGGARRKRQRQRPQRRRRRAAHFLSFFWGATVARAHARAHFLSFFWGARAHARASASARERRIQFAVPQRHCFFLQLMMML